uniref:FG-GAP repeat domain-containing protein n=1 Tax=Cysteiniphilum halobium TaxID=2219059 RepID=UPI0013C2EE63
DGSIDATVNGGNNAIVTDNGDGTVSVDFNGDGVDVVLPSGQTIIQNGDGTVTIQTQNGMVTVSENNEVAISDNTDGTINIDFDNDGVVDVVAEADTTVIEDKSSQTLEVTTPQNNTVILPKNENVAVKDGESQENVSVDFGNNGVVDAFITTGSKVVVNDNQLMVETTDGNKVSVAKDAGVDISAPTQNPDVLIDNTDRSNKHKVVENSLETISGQRDITIAEVANQATTQSQELPTLSNELSFDIVRLNFGEALRANEPVEVLTMIAGYTIKDILINVGNVDYSSELAVRQIIQQAIEARKSPMVIANIASGMVGTASSMGNPFDFVVKGVIAQSIDSSLGSSEITQILSQMILDSEDDERDFLIRMVADNQQLDQSHMVRIFNYLKEKDPLIAETFAKEIQLPLASMPEQTNMTIAAEQLKEGMLSKLKAMLVGNYGVDGQKNATYDVDEQRYKVELAKAKLLANFGNAKNDNNKTEKS